MMYGLALRQGYRSCETGAIKELAEMRRMVRTSLFCCPSLAKTDMSANLKKRSLVTGEGSSFHMRLPLQGIFEQYALG